MQLLISGILALLDYATPLINDAAKKGEVSAGDQAALNGRVNALRAATTGEFTGPEWEPSTTPTAAT